MKARLILLILWKVFISFSNSSDVPNHVFRIFLVSFFIAFSANSALVFISLFLEAAAVNPQKFCKRAMKSIMVTCNTCNSLLRLNCLYFVTDVCLKNFQPNPCFCFFLYFHESKLQNWREVLKTFFNIVTAASKLG